MDRINDQGRPIDLRHIAQHVRGERIDVQYHMCPECGTQCRIFCQFCSGTGQVTTEGLSRWQTAQWLAADA